MIQLPRPRCGAGESRARLKPRSFDVLALALALSMTAGCTSATPHVSEMNRITADEHSPWVPDGYRLVWNDEFWHLRMDPLGTGHGDWTDHIVGSSERYLASNSDDAWHGWDGNRGRIDSSPVPLHIAAGGSIVNSADGALHLWGRRLASNFRSHFDEKPYAAAMVTTEKSFDWLYGYLEVRARIKRISKGHHFALWMLPSPWDWHQEIDILEVLGTEPAEFSARAHDWNAEGKDTGGPATKYPAPDGGDCWHTFGLFWSPAMLKWTVDGELIKQQVNFITRKMYFLASWEIDSRASGPVTGTTEWPAHVELDYVRVYQD